VPPLQAIESTSSTVESIACTHGFAGGQVNDECDLQLPKTESAPANGVTRPAVSIVLNGKAATDLAKFLENVGIRPLAAIESTSLSTGKVSCSTSFIASVGTVAECDIAPTK
jgi:hypothetical protein